MFNFSDRVIITKDFILEKISEEEIFEYYLGIRPEYGKTFCNPLRKDKSPSCNFKIDSANRIKFYDPGGGFNWDCFNVVEFLNKGCSFKEALSIVATDFRLKEGTISNIRAQREVVARERIQFRIKRRDWNKEDKEFWFDKYYQTRSDLLYFDTFPVSHAWYVRNGLLELFYSYRSGDPMYAYHWGEYDYQLYLPNRPKGSKFKTSKSDIVFGLNKLPEKGHILIYTKSYKDVLCIRKFQRVLDIYAVAPASETIVIPEETILDLDKRFDYKFTLFDFDRAGIRLMRKYEKLYNLPHLMFGKKYKKEGIKDFSDHLSIKGYQLTEQLLKEVYEQRINS